MKRTNTNIVRFEDGDFWVDIVDDGDVWEAWLTRKNYAISELMFGWPKTQPDGSTYDFDAFCELVEGNLEEYEADYMESRQEED